MLPQARKRCHSDHYMQMHAQLERRKLLTGFLAVEKKMEPVITWIILFLSYKEREHVFYLNVLNFI
jgi:hypothetical protein